MDRRAALKLLASAGAGATAAVITSGPAMAAGGSAVPPTWDGGNPEIFFVGVSGTGVAIQAGSQSSFRCGAAQTAPPPGSRSQFRIDRTAGPAATFVGPGGVGAGTWFTATNFSFQMYKSNTTTFPTAGIYTISVEERKVCCSGASASWICKRVVRTFEVTATSVTNVSPSSFPASDPAVCNSPAPTCP